MKVNDNLPHPLTTKELTKLLEEKPINSKNRNILMEHSLWLIIQVVSKYKKYADLDVLTQIGAVGVH